MDAIRNSRLEAVVRDALPVAREMCVATALQRSKAKKKDLEHAVGRFNTEFENPLSFKSAADLLLSSMGGAMDVFEKRNYSLYTDCQPVVERLYETIQALDNEDEHETGTNDVAEALTGRSDTEGMDMAAAV